MVGFFARNWSFKPLEGVKDAELQGVVALTVALHVVFFRLGFLQVHYVHDGGLFPSRLLSVQPSILSF
jgi:hypothetical protein